VRVLIEKYEIPFVVKRTGFLPQFDIPEKRGYHPGQLCCKIEKMFHGAVDKVPNGKKERDK